MKGVFIRGWQTILLVVLLLLFTLPILLLIVKSLTTSWVFPNWLPTSFSLRGWNLFIEDAKLFKAILTTVEIGLAVVVINIILGITAAKGLSQFYFKGKTFIETLFLLPILVPTLAIAMGLHLTMIRLGLSDSKTGVILIHLLPTLPYSIRIFKAGFDQLGKKWEEQARSLGIKSARIFWSITLPMLLPNIRSVTLLIFVISLSQYALTAIIGGGVVTTLPMIYYPFFNSSDETVLASLSILFALLPLTFLTVLEILIYMYIRIVRR